LKPRVNEAIVGKNNEQKKLKKCSLLKDYELNEKM
jgi:hypothetical protein